jgi:hypothetical protein
MNCPCPGLFAFWFGKVIISALNFLQVISQEVAKMFAFHLFGILFWSSWPFTSFAVRRGVHAAAGEGTSYLFLCAGVHWPGYSDGSVWVKSEEKVRWIAMLK